KDFHKLVWNVYITPEVFQERWHNLILKYNLSQNTWLSDMYAIRERWVPGYFRELPFCGLMKTTSRSKSSNAFFQVYSHQGNSLVHFMLCFESAMEKQRYTQRVLDNLTIEKTLVMLTRLPIERHACEIDFCTNGDVDHCRIRQRDKRSNTVVEATVKDLKQQLEIDASSQNMPQNKDSLYEDILGVKAPPRISIKNPKKCPNKGHRRFKVRLKKLRKSDEDEEVNESEKDNDVDEYDDVEEDDELDKDDANDDYDEDEDDV
nr:hypothetical protein [Tanacetum cinerariifolium]